jgi:hypothetical protein
MFEGTGPQPTKVGEDTEFLNYQHRRRNSQPSKMEKEVISQPARYAKRFPIYQDM